MECNSNKAIKTDVNIKKKFPALPWEFSLKGRIPAVTMVWVG